MCLLHNVVSVMAVRPAEQFLVAFLTSVSSAMFDKNPAVETGCIVRVPPNQLLIMWIKMLDRGCC